MFCPLPERRDGQPQADLRDDAAGPGGAGERGRHGAGDERPLRPAVGQGAAGPPAEGRLPDACAGRGTLQQQRAGLLRAGGRRLAGTAVSQVKGSNVKNLFSLYQHNIILYSSKK